jgi:hypothetical protein
MRVRVPIMRTLVQFTDVVVPNVESVEAAMAQVDQALDHKLTSARLLRGVTWSDLDVTDLGVVAGGAEEQLSEE